MNVTTLPCVGGSNLHNDLLQVQTGVQILIGTPGRMSLMIQRGLQSE